jgi:hypothetical protein
MRSRLKPVDLGGALDVRDLERDLEQDQGDDGERHADKEGPAPSQRAVHDEAAEQRTAGSADSHDAAHVAGVLATFTRRDDGADDCLREGSQATHGDALDHAGGEQERDVFREAGHDGAGNEDHDAQLDEDLLVEEVGELAPDGGGGCVGQQRGRDDPGEIRLGALELGHDGGQGVRHDGAAEDCREEGSEKTGQGLHDLPVVHGCPGFVALGLPRLLFGAAFALALALLFLVRGGGDVTH